MQKFSDIQELIATESHLETSIDGIKSDSLKWFNEFKKAGTITEEIRNQYTAVNKQLSKVTTEIMAATSELQKTWDELSVLMLTRKYPDPEGEEENGVDDLDEKTINTILKPRKLSIFISYKKTLKSEVDEIVKIFISYGIKEVICHESIKYLENKEDFMKKVRTTSFALLFINKEYLESEDSMYQVLQLIKDENYSKRMTLLIHSDVDIYGSTLKAVPYIKYWNEKISSFNKEVKDTPTEATNSLSKEAKQLMYTKSEIVDFITSIANSNVDPYVDLKQKRFLPILRFIAKTTIDIPV